MMTDQLTAQQRGESDIILAGHLDWGLGLSVIKRRVDLASAGAFGWSGGLGTVWASDPEEDLVGILMTQAAWASAVPPRVALDFWTSAYQAVDD
jgi:CubicO group peptidase (beta-lactamase class C family)